MTSPETDWAKELAEAGPKIWEAKHGDPDGVQVRVASYEVSMFPPDDHDGQHFALTVEWRGKGKWGVFHMGSCLGPGGEWDWESNPSSRTDEWLETHRFDCATALRLAREWAPKVTVNGHVAAEVAGRRVQEQA